VCHNAEFNENSSSKLEEVPEGRRSMIATKLLIIKTFDNVAIIILPPNPLYLRGGAVAD